MFSSGRHFRAGLTAAVMAGVLALSGSGAFGDPTPTGPKDPQAQLNEVRQRIAAAEQDVERLKARLLAVAARLSEEEAAYGDVVTSVAQERQRLTMASNAYNEAKRQLNERVRIAYMGGDGASWEAMLGAPTLGDLSLILETQNRQAQSDGALAVQTGDLQQQAADGAATVSDLLAKQSDLLTKLDARRQELSTQFAQQQTLLDQLVASRRQLQELVRSQHIRANGSAGMTITFDQWAAHFLDRLAVPGCQSNVVAVVAWETAEYTTATWNPLATTYSMPGATKFNSAGVKNYRSLNQGLDATVSTLLLGVRSYGYGDIIAGLAECSPPIVTAEAIRASDWCHGCAGGNYVTSLVPSVEAYLGG
jgi:peptidoglycan hydrolase CwlO-like protein